MAKVEMYATAVCPYCIRAEALLKRKGVETIEKYYVDRDPALRQEMERRVPGARTVPQIFIDGVHVGGCDDLHELDRQGKLDPLLAR
ncbi:MAG: glutaredoxin 3 [Rhodocyclaceae bacterium]|nr:glutaredoxin 3 [Rhodocyclaceae bacterium]